MKKLLHTPEGVRDIINVQCGRKHALQNRILKIFHQYGYHDIQTPMFEYFDVFRKEIGTVPSRDLYKLFDKEGNTLALRPDITPSVARAAATLFADEELSIRLCYTGNTFINHSSYQGRLKENTQLGAELIGEDSIEADAEMLAMVVDGLKRAGLTEFQVNIGHVNFIRGLMEAAGFTEEITEEIFTLINNRNYFGVEEILDRQEVSDEIKEVFSALPELMGGAEVLTEAARLAPTAGAKAAITRLLKIYQVLIHYGVEKHITFDLSMSGSYMYYTGIIFRAYTYGTGDAVVRGGRYDHLLEKFGKRTPSIGFAMIVDELTSALSRQKITIETKHSNLIIYTEKTLKWAVSLAREFREKGRCIELIKRGPSEDKEKFREYGKRTQAVSMLYLQEDGMVELLNFRTGKEKTVDYGKERVTE